MDVGAAVYGEGSELEGEKIRVSFNRCVEMEVRKGKYPSLLVWEDRNGEDRALRTYKDLKSLRVRWRRPLDNLIIHLAPSHALALALTTSTHLMPLHLHLATVSSTARWIGGCGITTPSHLITPKHSRDSAARRRTSACSSLRHGNGTTPGSRSHGFTFRSVSTISFRSEGEWAIGSITDATIFCPSICE